MDLERIKLNLPREKEVSSGDGRRRLLITDSWPVRRFFARLFDSITFTAVCFIGTSFVWRQIMNEVLYPKTYNAAGVPQQEIPPFSLTVWSIPISIVAAFILASFILWLIEPISIRANGGTPGKSLLSLCVLDEYGEPLKKDRKALRRTLQVYKEGLAYYCPVLSQMRAWKAYKQLKGGELLTPWDKDHHTVVVCVNPKKLVGQIIGYVIVAGGLTVLAFAVVMKLFLLSFTPNEKQLEMMQQAASMLLR